MHVTSCMQKTKEIFADLIQTLTSDARDLNPKACSSRGAALLGVWGAKPPTNIFYFNQMNKMFFDKKKLKISEVFIFTWKIRNVLERMKNYFSKFAIFSLWNMVVSVLKIA